MVVKCSKCEKCRFFVNKYQYCTVLDCHPDPHMKCHRFEPKNNNERELLILAKSYGWKK